MSSKNTYPRCEIRQFVMYQIRTVKIKQGSFFRYRFLISGLILAVIN